MILEIGPIEPRRLSWSMAQKTWAWHSRWSSGLNLARADLIRASSAGDGGSSAAVEVGWPSAPAVCKSLIVIWRSSSILNSY